MAERLARGTASTLTGGVGRLKRINNPSILRPRQSSFTGTRSGEHSRSQALSTLPIGLRVSRHETSRGNYHKEGTTPRPETGAVSGKHLARVIGIRRGRRRRAPVRVRHGGQRCRRFDPGRISTCPRACSVFTVAITLLGCAVGAWFAGRLADRWGRKKVAVAAPVRRELDRLRLCVLRSDLAAKGLVASRSASPR